MSDKHGMPRDTVFERDKTRKYLPETAEKTDFTGKLFAFVQLQVYNRAGVKDM